MYLGMPYQYGIPWHTGTRVRTRVLNCNTPVLGTYSSTGLPVLNSPCNNIVPVPVHVRVHACWLHVLHYCNMAYCNTIACMQLFSSTRYTMVYNNINNMAIANWVHGVPVFYLLEDSTPPLLWPWYPGIAIYWTPCSAQYCTMV